MNSAVCENGSWTPETEEDKEMVRQQMNRLLGTSHFKNSRRYPLLFRFIVEETLEGRGEFLKERLLGVRVFDRPADYDTATDPIVRVTIAEIRKRIAQYYHEEAHDAEMRIELLPGHYIPEFHLSRDAGFDYRHASSPVSRWVEKQTVESESILPPAQPVAASRKTFAGRLIHSPAFRYVLVALTVLLIAVAAGAVWKWSQKSAVEELWGSFLTSRSTVIFCLPVGTRPGEGTASAAGIIVHDQAFARVPLQNASSSDSSLPGTFLAHEALGENVVFSDTLAALRISNYLAVHNRASNFRPNTVTTLDDLRQGPVVLLGGLDNQWTLRALASWRYRFAGTDSEQYWIVDAKQPAMTNWSLDLKVPLSNVKRDFAIIARIHDESTGQVEMIVAGIGMSGTAAAGEFLVDPQHMEALRRRVGAGFRSRDFEAVLSTDVVDGIAGSPVILAVEVR